MNAPLRMTAAEYRRSPTKRRDEEHGIQVAVATALRLAAAPGVFYCSIPNGGKRNKREAARLKAEGVIAGAPDLLVIVRGVPMGLELKTDRGAQSDEQEAVEAAWNAAGGVYVVAHGLREALDCLTAWGALRSADKARAG